MYIYSRKYHRRNRRLVGLVSTAFFLGLGLAGLQLFSKYQHLSRTTDTTINNTPVTTIGYINPYFMFKDSGKWVQDKSQTSPSEVVYYQYANGTAVRELSVYINKTPSAMQLSSSRVLPVSVINGDSINAGNLSDRCGTSQTANSRQVKEINFDGVNTVCDPNPNSFSVALAQPGGDYNLHMAKSNNPLTVVILYKDFSGHPDAQNIVNIANSFKLI
ncbi:MAG TPA: hypothetical protein VFH37_00335 [Candidatus Saccharimonadales bacterium]|nr:hypothetical protein [Candidatus Saccharimonadales bacterium]